MQTTRLLLDGIETGERLRPLDQSRVDTLANSIKEIGLRTPLTVMSRADGVDTRMILVAGNHRLAALKQLGEEAVDAFVLADDEIEAQLWEIAENLHRADLSKEQRDAHIRRYAELLEIRQSTQIAPIESKRADRKGHRSQGIAAKVSAQTGVSKDTVRRALNPSRAASERSRASLSADNKARAAKEMAAIIAEHVPSEWWDAAKANLYAAGAANIAEALSIATSPQPSPPKGA